MKIFSVEPWELISFFAQEPEIPEGETWPYTDALSVVNTKDINVSCAVAPADRAVLSTHSPELQAEPPSPACPEP
jgi:hypothetical protein